MDANWVSNLSASSSVSAKVVELEFGMGVVSASGCESADVVFPVFAPAPASVGPVAAEG